MSRIFCLALFFIYSFCSNIATASSFLEEPPVRKDQVKNVLEHEPVQGEPLCRHTITGPIEATLCDYEIIESINELLYTHLHELVQTPFFRYFQVDLYRECPFWLENGYCMNRECGITTVDESEVPEKWRAATLSKLDLSPPDQRIQLPGCYYRDSDFCFLDDLTEGDYFDLSVVPERYTGYSGPSANRVWKAIYEENCFGLPEKNHLIPHRSPAPDAFGSTLTGFRGTPASDNDEECLEKRTYYKIISGLHASISTHICADYLNQTTGEWGLNIECFTSRVASYPERLQYIYFNTVLLLRAVARVAPYLSAYDYCAESLIAPGHVPSRSEVVQEIQTLTRLESVLGIAKHVGKFDERMFFQGENANVLKQEFKEHFRNVSRIMDCIGCDKCRLWGKVQTTGVATALKILFEMDEKALDPHNNQNLLQRSEVVALINTLHRFSESLHIVEQFREMWKHMGQRDSERLIHEVEKALVDLSQKPPFIPKDSSREPEPEPQSSLAKLFGNKMLVGLQAYLIDFVVKCGQHLCHLLSEMWWQIRNTIPLRGRTEL